MKKHIIILLFIIMTISIAISIFSRPLNDLDEIWNFNFAKCISSGKIPYKEINMIVTPLSSIIAAVALLIFGKQLLVMRILAVLLATSILFIIYKILKLLKINNYISILTILLICINYISTFVYDYNFLLVSLILLIIYLELKNSMQSNYSLKINFLIGLLAGLCVVTKQTVGSICLLIALLNNIWLINSKNDLKQYTKILSMRLSGSIIPISLFGIYLIYNNALNAFLDYCVLGIGTFKNKISYLNLILNSDIKISIMSVLIPVSMIICIIFNLIKKPKLIEEKNIYILLVYSVCSFILSFPISDTIHFMIGILPGTILILYILYCKFKDISKIDIKWKKVFVFYMLGTIMIFSVINIFRCFNNNFIKSDLKHFNNILINKELYNEINIVQNYIANEEDKVYIIDSTASIYFIPLDIYNKDYDLFLIGNCGKAGTSYKIRKLCEKNNIKILINSNEENINWQISRDDIEYIKNNKEKIGTIERFDIYE